MLWHNRERARVEGKNTICLNTKTWHAKNSREKRQREFGENKPFVITIEWVAFVFAIDWAPIHIVNSHSFSLTWLCRICAPECTANDETTYLILIIKICAIEACKQREGTA